MFFRNSAAAQQAKSSAFRLEDLSQRTPLASEPSVRFRRVVTNRYGAGESSNRYAPAFSLGLREVGDADLPFGRIGGNSALEAVFIHSTIEFLEIVE